MHTKLARLEELVRGGFLLEDITSDTEGIQVVLVQDLMRLTLTFSRADAAVILGDAPVAERASHSSARTGTIVRP